MKKLITLLLFISIGYSTTAQEIKISTEVKDHIKQRVDEEINTGIVVALIDGESVEYFSYGTADLKTERKVDENSIFEIGSISKTFTGIMIADEIVKGNMKLSDPISNYLSDHTKVPTRNDREITIRDVATHSSSLPRMPDNFKPANLNNPYADYTIEMAYEFISGVELDRDIGEKYEYSNLALGMLGHILELQYKKDYEAILVDKIANTLGMDNTRVVFTPNMIKHLAKGHENGEEVENWDLPALVGAGGIRSSAVDMVKYVQANMGVIKSPLYDAMQLSHKTAYENEDQKFEIGLTWHFDNDGAIVQHGGATGGYRAFAGFLRGTEKGVVVLTNSTEGIGRLGIHLLDNTTKLRMPKKSIAIDLQKEIKKNGLKNGIAFYKKAKKEQTDKYDFDEGELNNLGYEYLGNKDLETALVLFKLNVEMNSKSSNPYDSLAEALLMKGDTVNAITNYKKSVELNPANENGIKVLESLGIAKKDLVKEVSVSAEVLETYNGKYELGPGFFITITSKGEQLFALPTGQNQAELFPKSDTEFYLKVVAASITFSFDGNGKVESLTLFQGGREMPGKKVE
jgi:CubicO group peptidase (beta-lactamase class C family)